MYLYMMQFIVYSTSTGCRVDVHCILYSFSIGYRLMYVELHDTVYSTGYGFMYSYTIQFIITQYRVQAYVQANIVYRIRYDTWLCVPLRPMQLHPTIMHLI